MAKTYITIGKEYQSAFDSICVLFENGCIDKSIIERVDSAHTRIETSEFVFSYDDTSAYIRTEEVIGMTKEGATWFKAFRGGEMNNDMAAWHNFIESVSRNYHKNYSLFECEYEKESLSEGDLIKFSRIGEDFMSVFYPDMHAVSVAELVGEASVEDVFVITLRVSLSGGTGESKPVLAKAFFRKNRDRFKPITAQEAEKMDDFLDSIIENRTGEGVLGTDSAMIDRSLEALEMLVSDGEAFSKSIMIDEKSDCDAVNAMVKSGPNEHVTLECTEIKPLSISHIRWSNNCFVIANEGKPVFNMIVSVDGKITVNCVGCDALPVVDGSEITLNDGKRVILDAEKKNFGLTDKEITAIRKNSAVAEHYTTITCFETKRRTGINCTRYLCKNNALNLGTKEEPEYKCKDCPYPESVYVYPDGRRALTKNLVYALDKMEMVDKKETFTCSSCHRSFTLDSAQRAVRGGKGLCSFCSSALRQAQSEEPSADKDYALYKRYAQMLPVGIRLKTKASRKSAFEREDIILFVMGEKRFIVKKTDIKDTGALKSPVEIE